MHDWIQATFALFLRSGLCLTLAVSCVWLLIRLLDLKSPRVHRAAWGTSLVCGIIVVHWSLEVPWYDPPVAQPLSTERNIDEDELPEMASVGGDSPSRLGKGAAHFNTAPTASRSRWTLQSVTACCWLAGLAIGVALLGFSYGLLLRTLRAAVPAHGHWRHQWQSLCDAHQIKAQIPLLVHSRLGPLLCRLPRGYAVVVPREHWSRFTDQERLTILRHELAHYQRGDVWTALIARLLALPHWYNPLAWWAVRRFEEGGEWACDQQLLSDPQAVPAFARALLSMTTVAEQNRVCTTAARGSSLAVRIRRLLSHPHHKDSIMKRFLMATAVFAMLIVSFLQVDLVVRGQEDMDDEPTSQQFEEQAATFSDRLADSKALSPFKAALQTDAGKIVLRDHVSYYSDRLRQRASNEAIPQYFDERFERTASGRLELREGEEAYRARFLQTVSTFNEDVEKIRAALQELATQFAARTDADRLLIRFMQHEASAPVLYIAELRERLRPDVSLVERLLGRVFVDNGEGKYIVRPGRRDEATQFLARIQRSRKAVAPLHAELQEWSKEVVEKDEFHTRIKRALQDRAFAAFIATELLGDYEGPASERLDEFYEHLGDLLVDTAEGLEVADDERREELSEALEEYSQTRRAAEKLGGALKQFAARIDRTEELEQGWHQILSSDVSVVRLGDEYEFIDSDPEKIVRALLSEVLDEDDDGKLFVREDRAEELTEQVREFFRQFRSIRAKGRTMDSIVKSLADEDLKEAFASNGGKYAVLLSIQQKLRRAEFNGFDLWVEEHFVEVDNGLQLRDGAEEMIDEFLEQVDEVNAELAKDDF